MIPIESDAQFLYAYRKAYKEAVVPGKRKLTDQEKRAAIAERRAKERARDRRAKFHIRIADETDAYGNPVFMVTKIGEPKAVGKGIRPQQPAAPRARSA